MIFYPPGKKVPGSYVWLDKTVGTWDATKVAEWKSKLVELGYLPKDAKVDANSETFQTALRNYWTSYYMHRGQATTLDEFSGGYSPGSDSFTSAAVLRGSIDANVTETYRGLYGIDPPQIELDTWRDRIVKIANQLQHRQDLDLGTAVNEATSRSVQKLESTPGAQFVTGNVEENTRLRDMIVRSVQVAQGMTS
jgi:hypothetical protein